jgi:hypothetical protein
MMRRTLFVVFALVIGACAGGDSEPPAAVGTSVSSPVPSGESSAPVSTDAASTTEPSTTALSATTRPITTLPTDTLPVSSTQPATTQPTSTEPDPFAECPLAASEIVELVITDNGVLYADSLVPPCVRMYASSYLSFLNNAEGDATVVVGSDLFELLTGDQADSRPAGEYAELGEVFDIDIAELETFVTVQVLADPT